MVIQLKLLGLALAGKVLPSPRSINFLFGRKSTSIPATYPKCPCMNIKKKNTTPPNPLQTLFKGLSASLSKFRQQPGNNYENILKGFVPENSEILIPRHPLPAGKFQLADLDGDSVNELVTSYRLNDEVTTLVLKKQDTQWVKAAEIKNPQIDKISSINFEDVAGEGKKQILLGCKTKEGLHELRGYSLGDKSIDMLFSLSYDFFEILKSHPDKRSAAKTRLAIWNLRDIEKHNIDVLHWNGLEFEQVRNQIPYYYRRVLPYFKQRVRQRPADPSNWYFLASALMKAGMYTDGLLAVELGTRLSSDLTFRESFLNLKNRILERVK